MLQPNLVRSTHPERTQGQVSVKGPVLSKRQAVEGVNSERFYSCQFAAHIGVHSWFLFCVPDALSRLFHLRFKKTPSRLCTLGLTSVYKMNSRLKIFVIPLSLMAALAPSRVKAREPQVEVEQVLQTTKAWDGSDYQSYPTGQPQITVLRIKIPAHTALHWHVHPVISAGYIISGELTVEKQGTGEHITIHAGQALTETVGTIHRGFTTDQPVELVVFYAGQAGVPITVDKEKPAADTHE
jgi:quercetin dioxygenase-like cupin family protein